MFFNDLSELPNIADKAGCTIFVIPNDAPINLKNATVVAPLDDKNTISIDQVKEVIAHLNIKEPVNRYIIIREADKMTPDAANCFLKNLEEPGENYHIILQTENPSNLLPTILSRAAIFVLRTPSPLDTGITADDKIKELAKRLLVAKPTDLIPIMTEITKKKDNVRTHALEVLQATIEISYKSFFKTGNRAFLAKLPKLLKAYDNISRNGHVKLHLVADLL